MPTTNNLAYYEYSQITDVKSFITLCSGTNSGNILPLSTTVGHKKLKCFVLWCRFALFHVLFIVLLSVVMLSLIMLSVVMLSIGMLSIVVLSIVMLSIVMLSIVVLSIVMLSIVMLSIVMLSIVMLSIVMLCLMMLSVVMLSVTSPRSIPSIFSNCSCQWLRQYLVHSHLT